MEITTNKIPTAGREKMLTHCINATPSNIIPSRGYRLRNLCDSHTHDQVERFLSYLFLKICELSSLPTPLSDPAAIQLIINTWMANNMDKDVREFAIIIKNGITGVYGPNYNKISIDSLGIWTKEYNTTTRPQIQARLEEHNRKNGIIQPTLPAHTPKAIPCPPDIAAATDQLVKKYRVDLTPRRTTAERKKALLADLVKKKHRPFYESLEHYCQELGLDYETWMTEHQERWLMALSRESSVNWEEYTEIKRRQLLQNINTQALLSR